VEKPSPQHPLHQVNMTVLREIIGKFVAIKKLVNHGTADKPIWKREYVAPSPNEMTLRTLLTAQTLEEGGLIWRVPKA
jgi:hypothetical protein